MRQHSTPAIFFSCLVAAAGCPAPAPAPGPLAPLPVVQGLVPALDEDPADHSVRFRIVAREGIIELVDGTQTLGLTYNGMSPGPLLQAHLGDTVTIEVENQLLEPTTIHWHGLRIDDAMDGVAHGEVAPIPPGETFTYTFVPPEAGTFWYHPHLNTAVQIEAGLYGMLVVHEPEETRPSVNAERGFILDDIRLDDDGQIAPHQSAGPDIMHGRLGETLLVNGSASMPVVKLGPGQVERWRIVSAASSWTTLLRFEGLEVRQVGADGGLWPQNECKPVTQVEIPVGARAELEVRLADGATTARVDNIMLALDENNNVVEDPRLAVKVEIDATLAVAEPLEGHTADPQYQHLTDDGAVEKTIEISGENVGGQVRFTLNGHSYPDIEEWRVQKGQLTVIEVTNRLGMEHPFHLHGNWFQVVSRSGTSPVETGLRDTVLVHGQETVRVVTDFENPGMWMYHCHILEHEDNGMMGMVHVEGEHTGH